MINDANDGGTSTSGEGTVSSVSSHTWQQNVASALDSRLAVVFFSFWTFVALFGADVRTLAFDNASDIVFTGLFATCLAVFLVELVANMAGKTSRMSSNAAAQDRVRVGGHTNRIQQWLGIRGYTLSFFFFLDLVAILSLVPEIPELIEPILGSTVTSSGSNLSTARAGRITRVGSRIGRLLRMVRLFRLLKLYFLVQGREGDEAQAARQSRIGERLAQRTTRRVIVLTLVMLLALPFFTAATDDETEEAGIAMAHDAAAAGIAGWQLACSSLAAGLALWDPDVFVTQGSSQPVRLVRFFVEGNVSRPDACEMVDLAGVYSTLREGLLGRELVKVTFSSDTPAGVVTSSGWFNHRPVQRDEAVYSILLTLFVLVILVLGSFQVASDAQRLVLKPIETLVEFLDRPSTASRDDLTSKDNTGMFETKLVENTIKKLVNMLRVGFGPAGSIVAASHLLADGETVRPESLSGGRQKLREVPLLVGARGGSSAARGKASSPHLTAGGPRVAIDDQAMPQDIKLNPFVEGRPVRVVVLKARVAGADRASTVLRDRWPVMLNRLLKLVHEHAVAWGGSPSSSSAEGTTCSWVIDDAWDGALQTPLFGSQPPSGEGLGYLEQRRASLGLPAVHVDNLVIPSRPGVSGAASFTRMRRPSISVEASALVDLQAKLRKRSGGKPREGGGEKREAHPVDDRGKLSHLEHAATASAVVFSNPAPLSPTLPSTPQGLGSVPALPASASATTPSRIQPRAGAAAAFARASRGGDNPADASQSTVMSPKWIKSLKRQRAIWNESESSTKAEQQPNPHDEQDTKTPAKAAALSTALHGALDIEMLRDSTSGSSSIDVGKAGPPITQAPSARDGPDTIVADTGKAHIPFSQGQAVKSRQNRIAALLSSARRMAQPASGRAQASSYLRRKRRRRASDSMEKGQRLDLANKTADRVLGAALSCLAALNKCPDIQNSDEFAELDEEEPGFAVQLCFSLDIVWAVEGLVGSAAKVECAHISPLARRSEVLLRMCEASSAPLLMTDPFRCLLSNEPRSRCRLIDVVPVPPALPNPDRPASTAAETEPCQVYSCDIWMWQHPMQPNQPLMPLQGFLQGPNDPDELNRSHAEAGPSEYLVSLLGEADIVEHPVRYVSITDGWMHSRSDLKALVSPYNDEWLAKQREALRAMVDGRWRSARDDLIAATLSRVKEFGSVVGDGPTARLLLRVYDRLHGPGGPPSMSVAASSSQARSAILRAQSANPPGAPTSASGSGAALAMPANTDGRPPLRVNSGILGSEPVDRRGSLIPAPLDHPADRRNGESHIPEVARREAAVSRRRMAFAHPDGSTAVARVDNLSPVSSGDRNDAFGSNSQSPAASEAGSDSGSSTDEDEVLEVLDIGESLFATDESFRVSSGARTNQTASTVPLASRSAAASSFPTRHGANVAQKVTTLRVPPPPPPHRPRPPFQMNVIAGEPVSTRRTKPATPGQDTRRLARSFSQTAARASIVSLGEELEWLRHPEQSTLGQQRVVHATGGAARPMDQGAQPQDGASLQQQPALPASQGSSVVSSAAGSIAGEQEPAAAAAMERPRLRMLGALSLLKHTPTKSPDGLS
jgi:hypothetical protein